MTEDQIIARGHRARVFLSHADTYQAFADVQAQLFTEWSIARDERERESLHAVLRASERLLGQFRAWADELTRRNL